MTGRSRPFGIWMAIVGVAWLLGGAVMLVLGGARVRAGFGSQQWPPVQGKITKSDLSAVKSASGVPAFYRVNVVYSYTPPGEPFARNNNRLSTRGFVDPADDSYSCADAQRLTRRFPVGGAVTVYYRPDATGVSTLRPGEDLGTWSPCLLGLALCLLGLLIVIAVARKAVGK